MLKTLTALILTAVLVSPVPTSAVSAVSAGTLAYAENEVTVTLDDTITITYNAEKQNLCNAQGNTVYPAIYNGTTYIPIRALSYVLGIDVNWDQATQTVTLDSTKSSTQPYLVGDVGETGNVGAELMPSITILYNDSKQIFKDVNGRQVDPLVYRGTTYLPIRGVSTMLDMQINWIQDTRTVAVTGEPAQTEICTPCEYRAKDLISQHYTGEAEGQYIVPHTGDIFENNKVFGTIFSNQLFITSSYDKDNIYYFDTDGNSKVTVLAISGGLAEVTSLVAVNPDTGEERSISCQSLQELKAGSYDEEVADILSKLETNGVTPEKLQDMCSNLGVKIDISGWDRVGFYFTSTEDDTVTIMSAQMEK